MINKVITYTDGASRGNPGPAGIGALLLDETGKTVAELSDYIGVTTNNEAEYRALLLALDAARKFTEETVQCFLDSELVVRQLTGQYAVKSEKMVKLHADVREKIRQFQSVTFTHVPRETPNQKIADRLANRGIDAMSSSRRKPGSSPSAEG